MKLTSDENINKNIYYTELISTDPRKSMAFGFCHCIIVSEFTFLFNF